MTVELDITVTKKKIPAPRRHSNLAPITQRELRQFVRRARLIQEHDQHLGSLIERLAAGARVEPGQLHPAIEIEMRSRLSRGALESIIGEENATYILEKLRKTPCRALKFRHEGKLIGWRDFARQKESQESESLMEWTVNPD
jgi:hypothetical protein